MDPGSKHSGAGDLRQMQFSPKDTLETRRRSAALGRQRGTHGGVSQGVRPAPGRGARKVADRLEEGEARTRRTRLLVPLHERGETAGLETRGRCVREPESA